MFFRTRPRACSRVEKRVRYPAIRNGPRSRRLQVEPLEDRRMSNFGDLLHTLHDPAGASNDFFGYSVAMSGRTVVVGSPGDDTGAANAGMAYIYDAVTGNLLNTLAKPTPAVSDGFGSSVAVSGTTVVVVAYGARSAYVFDATTASLLWTLNDPSPAADHYFGSSVAVSGSTVVVDAPASYPGPTICAASVYVYDATTGNLLWTLTDPTPGADEWFGTVRGRFGHPGGRGRDGPAVLPGDPPQLGPRIGVCLRRRLGQSRVGIQSARL